ncbi:MAG: site-specific integrase [Planctomycetaceae bacterium]|nr:site-specific integrase [Planctomycetaceae bacterium]
MALHKLDTQGKPIPPRSRREPATRRIRGVDHYHYMVYVAIPQPGGKYRHVRRRYWLPDDAAAVAMERELKREAPPDALTWEQAYDRWKAENVGRLSLGHMQGVDISFRKWFADFGTSSTIEGTDLASFTGWLAEQAKGTKGRAAQLRQSHLLTVAKWCRSRGIIKDIPFEHAPKPAARLDKVRAATVEEFLDIGKRLPPQMVWLWRLLGLTGMRISAACDLLESDIGKDSFTVTTKGNKRVEYPITPEIREVIEGAREWKREKGFTSETLFCSFRGRRWKHYHFSEQLRELAKGYDITPHQLRHMAGTIMAEGNLSPDLIQAGLGHEDRSSAEAYIDQTRTMRKTALRTVSAAIKKVQKKSKNDTRDGEEAENEQQSVEAKADENGIIICPCCGCNIRTNK